MSERISREGVDQLVNGGDFNRNTLIGGFEQPGMDMFGMSLDDFHIYSNNDFGFANMGMPQIPGQTVSIIPPSPQPSIA